MNSSVVILVSYAQRYVWLFDRACEISFIYNKNNKGPNIDLWGTPQFMVPDSKNKLSNDARKELCLRDKSKTTLLSYLKNLRISFCLRKLCDLWWQKPFEDRLKSYQYLFYFQQRLKSCQFSKTNTYLWNDLLYNLIGKCATVHFFEDNPVWLRIDFSITFDIRGNRE